MTLNLLQPLSEPQFPQSINQSLQASWWLWIFQSRMLEFKCSQMNDERFAERRRKLFLMSLLMFKVLP